MIAGNFTVLVKTQIYGPWKLHEDQAESIKGRPGLHTAESDCGNARTKGKHLGDRQRKKGEGTAIKES